MTGKLKRNHIRGEVVNHDDDEEEGDDDNDDS